MASSGGLLKIFGDLYFKLNKLTTRYLINKWNEYVGYR